MKWTELVENEISMLVDEREKVKKRLDKIRDNDGLSEYERKVSLMTKIYGIDKQIDRLYILLGKAGNIEQPEKIEMKKSIYILIIKIK